MNFSTNHPLLFVVAGLIIAFVMAQSVFFLIKAWKHGLEIGMDKKKLKKIAVTAITFTIAPAIAIVISVITLAKDLGVALPWLRLSVIGSLSYETVAAQNALSAMGQKLGEANVNAQQYVTIAFVMTISIMVGVWLCPVVAEKMQKGMINLEKRDNKWSEIFNNSMFIGMISAFIGFVFCDVTNLSDGDTSCLVPVFVFAVSACVMGISGLILKKTHCRVVGDYALPVSLILGMASAIPLTQWLG